MVLLATFLFSYTTFSLHFSFQHLMQTNQGINNTPFKFTKHSNAYMLVYIRESDKDKIMCHVDEKDIAEHLRVRCWYQHMFFHISEMMLILWFSLIYMTLLECILSNRRGWRENRKKKNKRRKKKLKHICTQL